MTKGNARSLDKWDGDKFRLSRFLRIKQTLFREPTALTKIMKRFLLLPLLAALFISFQSCEKDEPGNAPDTPGQETPTPSDPEEPENPGTQTPETPKDQSVVVNQDGTTSTGVPFRWETNSTTIFYLNHVKYEIVDSHVEVIGADSYELEHTLKGVATLYSPITLNGYTYPLRALQKSAFSNSNLISIEIPASVINIGNSVFSSCKKLVSITLNKELESIGSGAFSGCTSLVSISLDGVKSIGRNAFSGCTSLTSIIFNGMSIGYKAFDSCSHLESITLDGVKIIASNAFDNCSSLKIFNLYNGKETSIECHSYDCNGYLPDFYGSKAIETITINGIAFIPPEPFRNLSSLKSVTLEDVKYIGTCAFENCSSLKSVVLPEGLLELGLNSFSDCTSLEEINFPSSLEYIMDGCFKNCQNLTSIIIPEGSQQLNFTIGAIRNCDSLRTLSLPSNANSAYYFYTFDSNPPIESSHYENMKLDNVYLPWHSPYKNYNYYKGLKIPVTNLHIPYDLKNWYLEQRAQDSDQNSLYGFNPENIIVLEE